MRARRAAAVLFLVACGSEIDTVDGGGGSGAASGGGFGSGAVGPSDCRTEEGYAVCGGKHNCFATDDGWDPECSCTLFLPEDLPMGWCGSSVPGWPIDFDCPDGGIIMHDLLGVCLPHEIGPLFCDGGGRDVLFFVDHQPYDCSPLPEPVDCPATGALELCGDACGPCQDPSDVCYGRSPRHPHSFCIPEQNGPYCSAAKPCSTEGRACFHFIHDGDPVAQALADEFGICLERSVCEAAAAEIPGGGRCEG
jgi:hypothetical protein